VGKDLRPLGEGLIGAKQDGAALVIATRNDLKEQVRVSILVGEIAHFIAP
jgi:hypothetical protein